MAMTFPDLAWHIPNVIPEGFTLLVGAPKVGKSWLVLGMVLATATGGKVLGERLEPAPCCTCPSRTPNVASSPAVTPSATGSPTPRPCPRGATSRTCPAGVPASDVIRRWVDTLPDLDPAPMIVVDTLGRVRGARRPSESPYDHDYRIGAAIKLVADEIPGARCPPSITTARPNRPTSSTPCPARTASPDPLTRSSCCAGNGTNRTACSLVTGRDVNEAAYGVTFADGHWALIGGTWAAAQASAARVAAVSGRGDLAQRIVAWLDQNTAGTPKDIAIALDEQPNTVKQSLYRMYSDNVLDRADGSYFLPAPTLPASPPPDMEEF